MKKKRVVIKFGSGILARLDGPDLDAEQVEMLTEHVAMLHRREDCECVVVSSGAVAAGLPVFGLDQRPERLEVLQACAAVGQTRLMHFYETLFARFDLHVGQLLLSHEDLEAPDRRRNFNNTLEQLLAFRDSIPIINENDSVAVEELRYGDNDLLSADVALLCKADLLILLTNVDGLYPGAGADETDIIHEVCDPGEVMDHASEEIGRWSSGGMASKLKAVRRAVEGGIETWIANGRSSGQLEKFLDGGARGTRFVPK